MSSPLSMLRAINTPLPMNATAEDMESFPRFLTKIWPRLVEEGAVCVSPPPCWKGNTQTLTDRLLITGRQQVLPHAPFASTTPHKKVLLQQRNFRDDSTLKIQNDKGLLMETPFIGTETVYTVERHRRLAKNTEQKCRRCLQLTENYFKPDGWSGMSDVHKDEVSFWHMMRHGLNNEPVKVAYAADVVLTDENDNHDNRIINVRRKKGRRVVCSSSDEEELSTSNLVQNAPATSLRATPHWNIDNINKTTLLRHMEDMPGINSCMYYIGGAFTFFSYHIEDECLSSVSFLCSGKEKVWYVANSASQTSFERVVASSVLDKKFLNDHNGGTRQILATKNILFNPMILLDDKSETVKISRIIQREGQFVILAPGAYHGGFNCGYNVAKATNFADFSWPEVGRLASRNKEIERPFMQCTIPVEMILWKEATSLVLFQSRNEPCPYKVRMAKSLSIALKNVITKAENIMYHFIYNDKGNVLNWDEQIHPDDQIVCFECKRKLFLYVQMCITCRYPTTTFCIHHSRPASKVCNVPCHNGSILRRLPKTNMSSVMKSLKEIAQNKPIVHSLRISRTSSRNKRRKLNRGEPARPCARS